MRIKNKNAIVLVLSILFVIVGMDSDYVQSFSTEVSRFSEGIKQGKIDSFRRFKENVEKISNNQMRGHYKLMDLNSIKENLLGTRVVFKPDTTVVKADSGSLIAPSNLMSETTIDTVVERVANFKEVVEQNNANFLYCAAPVKPMYEIAPQNINNFANENMDIFLQKLESANVSYLDCREVLNNSGIESSKMFYFTDHHWTAHSGFIATEAICKKLKELYGYEYNTDYTDINNYKAVIYKDWFLGSYGKKVGTFFTWNGADDFELIMPAFDTYMVEELPYRNEVRSGAFEDTVLKKDRLVKDYYLRNTYAAYSGGDYHLQIMKNVHNPDGKRMLIIRDSFACVVTPFLALQTSELIICDIRKADYISGPIPDIKKLITEKKPDYVIVLYSGVSSVAGSPGRYDFVD